MVRKTKKDSVCVWKQAPSPHCPTSPSPHSPVSLHRLLLTSITPSLCPQTFFLSEWHLDGDIPFPPGPSLQLTFDTRESHFTSEPLKTYRTRKQRTMQVSARLWKGRICTWAHADTYTCTHVHTHACTPGTHIPWSKSQGCSLSSPCPLTLSWSRSFTPVIARPWASGHLRGPGRDTGPH